MRERGKIVETAGSIAKVSLIPSAACESCPSCNLCLPAGTNRIIEAENEIYADVGDEVYIDTSIKMGLVAMFLLFVLPVMLALTGLLIAARYGEVKMVISGVCGFVLGLIIAKIVNNVFRNRGQFLPHIVEITSSKNP